MAETTELTRDEQLMEIEDAIEESVSYYVMCDECNGVTDIEKYAGASARLYEEGWRMLDKDNRVLLTCPRCVAPERDAEI